MTHHEVIARMRGRNRQKQIGSRDTLAPMDPKRVGGHGALTWIAAVLLMLAVPLGAFAGEFGNRGECPGAGNTSETGRHVYMVRIPCGEDPVAMLVKCVFCGETRWEYVDPQFEKHDFSNQKSWAGDDAYHWHFCSHCGTAEPGTKAPHQMKLIGTESSCTEIRTKYRCSVCERERTEVAEASEHVHVLGEPAWGWSEDFGTATATFACTKSGCGYSLSVEVPTTAETTQAKCGVAGKTVYTAKLGAQDSPDHLAHEKTKTVGIPAGQHTWVFKAFDWTGSDESGYVATTASYECTNETGVTHTNKADAVTEAVIQEPTCVAGGTKTYTARVSGDEALDGTARSDTKTVAVPAAGHAWDAWKIVREATAEQEGLEKRVCLRGDAEETRPILWTEQGGSSEEGGSEQNVSGMGSGTAETNSSEQGTSGTDSGTSGSTGSDQDSGTIGQSGCSDEISPEQNVSGTDIGTTGTNNSEQSASVKDTSAKDVPEKATLIQSIPTNSTSENANSGESAPDQEAQPENRELQADEVKQNSAAGKAARLSVRQFNAGNGTYSITDPAGGTAALIGWNGADEEVSVPDAVVSHGREYRVTEIGDGAFRENQTIQRIVLGPNVRTVGREAFRACGSLQVLDGMRSGALTAIGESAFAECGKLDTLLLNAVSLREIGNDAFLHIRGDAAFELFFLERETLTVTAGMIRRLDAGWGQGMTLAAHQFTDNRFDRYDPADVLAAPSLDWMIEETTKNGSGNAP